MVNPGFLRRLVWWALAAALLRPGLAAASTEQTFDVLQIGTVRYTNVTVTTKAPTYVFLLHAAGMTTIKVKDLTPELRVELGYDAPPKPAASANASAWAKQTLSKMDGAQMQQMEKQIRETWRKRLLAPLMKPGLIRSWVAQAALGLAVLIYFFFCHCCKLICEKTGLQPGPLVWVPFLQWVPLIRASNMSYWWLLAFLLPILNLVAFVLWSVNIAKARGKSVGVGILLLVPFVNIFAFLYLAFSNGPPLEPEKPIQLMGLEAA